MPQASPGFYFHSLRFRLGGFLALCVALGLAAGLMGRWWVRRNLPIVTIEDSTGYEGEQRDFNLTLSREFDSPVVVRFATADGTAKAGKDYVSISTTTVTFQPGDRWISIPVQTKADDDENELNENFYIRLISAAGANLGNYRAVGTLFNGGVPPDVAVSRFFSDGVDLKIEYMVSGDLIIPFQIAVFESFDGNFYQQLSVGTGEITRGKHTLTLSPTFDDRQVDYYLEVMLDINADVEETNEDNNIIRFEGGSFLVREPSSGKSVLHIHGTGAPDSNSDFTPATPDRVHFRGHGGDDRFDLDAFLPRAPGWLFGGDGDDTLTGGSSDDVIFGGADNDTIRAGDGDDLLIGGDGDDTLEGQQGKDELFGGAGVDRLFDDPQNSKFDGGPGRDLFNGSTHNPTLPPVFGTLRGFFRGVEDESELRVDLRSEFADLVKDLPRYDWHVNHDGAAIDTCWVEGDVLHVRFNPGVPGRSRIEVRAAPRTANGEQSQESGRTVDAVLDFCSILLLGYKIERKTGPGANDWTQDEGDLWASDELRWTPLYEPSEVPIQWHVRWLSKPSQHLDNPYVPWEVFSGVATGPTPIATPPSGIRSITPEFTFPRAMP